MKQCACSLDVDNEPNEYHISRIIIAHKLLTCGECRFDIRQGEKYEYVALKNDGEHSRYYTCLPRVEVRNCYCCNWICTDVWTTICEAQGKIDLSALELLSFAARNKFFENINT